MEENKFLEHFREALEMEENQELSLENSFRELNEWDSLAQLSLTAMLDEVYEVQLESEDLDRLNTIGNLYLFVKSKH